jgi:hypothetical protein
LRPVDALACASPPRIREERSQTDIDKVAQLFWPDSSLSTRLPSCGVMMTNSEHQTMPASGFLAAVVGWSSLSKL